MAVTATPVARPFSAATQKRQPAARPSCTHIVMNRVYGTDISCQNCHKIPSIGWIYICQQDSFLAESVPAITARKKHTKSKQRTSQEEMQSLGFNNSIVKAAQAGLYNSKQMEVLMAQKRHVNALINNELKDTELLKCKEGPPPDLLAEKLADVVKDSEIENDAAKSQLGHTSRSKSTISAGHKQLPPCDFRICHTCRPFSRDRSYISFEAAFDTEMEWIWIPELMPVADATVLANMTWTPKESSDESETQSDEDSGDELPRPHSSTSTRGFRHSLEESFRSLVNGNDSSETVSSKLTSSFKDENFDLKIWKKLMGHVQEVAAATRLPEKDSEDNLNFKSHTGASSEPQYVQGGVAVTEEAVETGSPDIIMGI